MPNPKGSSAAPKTQTTPTVINENTPEVELPPSVIEKLKKVDHIFDRENRASCSQCTEKKLSWSCIDCNRNLPNGMWADVGLAAEDRTESFFGKLRHHVQSGFVKEEASYAYSYQQAKFAVQSSIMFGDPTARLRLGSVKEWQNVFDLGGQKWADARLAAEDSAASIMGILRALSASGSIHPASIFAWAQFGFNAARCSAIVESILFEDEAQIPLPADLVNGFRAYCKSASNVPLAPAISTVIFECVDRSMAESSFQLPAIPTLGKTVGDQSWDFHPVVSASLLSGESLIGGQPHGIETPRDAKTKGTPRFTIGPPKGKYLKAVAEAVEARNKRLEEEQAQKDQIKKEKKAKKDEVAAKKACAQEDQRRGRGRKAERRKRDKAKIEGKQAKKRGPRGESQQPSVNFQVGSKNEDGRGVVEATSVEEPSAIGRPLGFQNDVESQVQEAAPTSSPIVDVAGNKSSSEASTLIIGSASRSVSETCDIDADTNCQCDDCKNYDLAVDSLESLSPYERPSYAPDTVEVLSPKPRSFSSASSVHRLEEIAASSQVSESGIPEGPDSKSALIAPHDSVDQATKVNFSKSAHDTRPSAHVFGTEPTIFQEQAHTNPSPRADELPDWVELSLAAEAADDSLSSRVQQLNTLGHLTDNDNETFKSIISKLERQMHLATRSDSHALERIGLSNNANSWCWADFDLAAEDCEDSIFGVCRKLAILGFWSISEAKVLHKFAMMVAKKWLVACSEPDTWSNVDPETDIPEMNHDHYGSQVRGKLGLVRLQELFEVTPLQTTSLSPIQAVNRLEKDTVDTHDNPDEEEVIVFKPRGRH